MKKVILSLVLMGVLFSGCAGIEGAVKNYSAGKVGCNKQDMLITNIDSKFGNDTMWNVTCKNTTYSCMKSIMNNTISCTEMK